MPAREEILFRIRKSLAAKNASAQRNKNAARRIGVHPSGTMPKVSNRRSMKARFIDNAIASAASVKTVRSYDKTGDAITAFLRDHNLPKIIRHGSDARLKKLGWSKNSMPEIFIGKSDGSDLVGLSHAEAGVVETGSLIMLSGKENPTTLNFLPENHIIIVHKKDLVEHYETIWTRLRRKYGKGKMPRAVNMICGPSRSADIEQTLILGAHGPLRLHVIIVDDGK